MSLGCAGEVPVAGFQRRATTCTSASIGFREVLTGAIERKEDSAVQFRPASGNPSSRW